MLVMRVVVKFEAERGREIGDDETAFRSAKPPRKI
jgi:hypothetical protein